MSVSGTSARRFTKLGEIAVVLALVAGTAWLGRVMHHNYVEHGSARVSAAGRVAPAALPARSSAGETAPVVLDGGPSLLLVLSTTCPYCDQNMPGWGRLIEEIGQARAVGLEVVVLSLSPAEDTAEYLSAHGVDLPVRLIDRAVLPLLGARGTPSTIAVDAGTRSIAVWEGVLQETDHEALMAWVASQAVTRAVAGAGAGGDAAP